MRRSEARFRVSCLPHRTLPCERTALASPPLHVRRCTPTPLKQEGKQEEGTRGDTRARRAHEEATETRGHKRRPPTQGKCADHKLTTGTLPMDQSQHKGYGQTKSCALME